MQESNVSLQKNYEQPNKMLGYVLAAVTALLVIVDLVIQMENSYGVVSTSWSNLLRLGFFIYFLIWVSRLHKIVAQQTNNQYTISPSKAVWFHFIPFFNFYWIFKWPLEMVNYIESSGKISKASKGQIIGFLIGGIVLMFIPIPVDRGVIWIGSLAILFIYLYILFSLYDSVVELDPNNEDAVENDSKEQVAVSGMDSVTGWLLVAMPGIHIFQTLLSFIFPPFGGFMRIIGVILTLAFWTAPLLISFRLKNQQLKIILMILSGLAILLTILTLFSERFRMMMMLY